MSRILFFLLFACPPAFSQLPDWKHTINLEIAQTFHIDQGDTIHMLNTALPQRLLKVSPQGKTLGYPLMQYNGIPFRGRVAMIDTVGGYLLAGGTADIQGFPRYAVAKIDLHSSAIVQLGYDTVYWPSPYVGNEPVILDRDQSGYVYLMGTAASEPSQTVNHLILKFDTNLNLFDSWFDPNAPDQLGTGQIGVDGSCYYNGRYYDTQMQSGRSYVEKMRFGTPTPVQWRYNLDGTQYVVAMREMPNGDLLWLLNESQNNNIYRTLVSRIHVQGAAAQVLWATEIPILDAELLHLHYDPLKDHVFVGGSFYLGEDFIQTKQFSGFACLNATDGARIWHNRPSPGGRYFVTNIGTDPAGRLCAVGSINFSNGGNGDTDVWMGHFSESGELSDLLTYKGVVPTGNETGLFFGFRSDGKLLVNGSTAEADFTSNWCTTLMYDSLLPVVSVSDFPTATKRLKVYPNPSSSWLQVEAEDLQEVDIEVVDAFGKTVMLWRGQSLPALLPLHSLPAGWYALKIRSDTSRATQTAVFAKW